MKFLVRGDCTSRRMLMLNRARFPDTFSLVTNEKAPNAVFCDYLDGRIASLEAVAPFIDESRMGKSQLLYYRRQYERNVLNETGASLLVIDPYSEMNFQLWRHRDEGWRIWVPKGSISDANGFNAAFESDGYRSIEQSVEDTVRVVRRIQENNPAMPVLFLPQILDRYPALAEREFFNDLGDLLKEHLPELYVGKRIPKQEQVPEDLGTGGGPDLTLHYSGETYWRCASGPIADGLIDAISDRNKELLKAQSMKLGLPAEDKHFSLERNSETCMPACEAIVLQVKTKLQEYFITYDDSVERTKNIRYRTAIIDLEKYRDFPELESFVKRSGKGNRIRLRNKAVSAGYYCKPFAWRLHIPDIHAVNTSTDVRSGGPMRASSVKSIEDMGGAPDRAYGVAKPKCPRHWSQPWGVFLSEPGYMQGNQETGERLYGYIFLRRFGECLVYSLIMGHHDKLPDGIMILLHHEVMRWVFESGDAEAEGVHVVMYGGYDQGAQGLQDWKRREGFEPFLMHAHDNASEC